MKLGSMIQWEYPCTWASEPRGGYRSGSSIISKNLLEEFLSLQLCLYNFEFKTLTLVDLKALMPRAQILFPDNTVIV